MIINHDRKKLIAAILYFSKNTENCSITKLIKLLYLFDFEHFKQTGRSATGLNYFAWKFGPVPTALYEEFDTPEPDFAENIQIEPTSMHYDAKIVRPLSAPDMSHFSKREVSLMQELANKYKLSTASELVKKTHSENSPWHKVYREQSKPQQLIPYEYAVDAEKDPHILELAEERKQIKDLYR